MEYLLIWLVFACAAYSLAKGKNRNAYLWALLGLLLGPFAVLLVALLPNGAGGQQKYH